MLPYDTVGDGESELIVTYTLGLNSRSSAVVQLTGVNVGNGQWHNISVVRERTHVTLSVDSDGDGYSVTGTVSRTLFHRFFPRLNVRLQLYRHATFLKHFKRHFPLITIVLT